MLHNTDALELTRYLTPAALLLAFASSFRSAPPNPKPFEGIISVTDLRILPRRSLILWLLSLIGLSSLLSALTVAVFAVLNQRWPDAWLSILVSSGGGSILWLASAIRAEWGNSYRKGGWLKLAAWVGLAGESVVSGILLDDLINHHSKADPLPLPSILHLSLTLLRLFLLPILVLALYNPIRTYVSVLNSSSESHERTPLDPAGSTDPASAAALVDPEEQTRLSSGPDVKGANGSTYGTFSNASGTITPKPSNVEAPAIKAKGPPGKDDTPQTWAQFFARLRELAPYLWPKTSPKLQLASVLCVIVVGLGRGVNILTPLSLGHVLDDLTNRIQPWKWLSVYLLLKLAQGSGGFLGVAQSMLWAPVMQYSDRRMSTMAFDHLLNLSLAWHTKKKTGEVLRILDRGSSLNNLFQLILFNISPIIFDVSAALAVFYFRFGSMLAGSILIVMATYVGVSIVLTTWRTKIRRAMNERDQLTRGIHADILMNWETVKYFTAEAHESARFAAAIEEYQALEYKVVGSLNLLNLSQNLIISLGLLVGSLLVAGRVVRGEANPSEFVVFLTYLAQLYAPLNNLGMLHRQLNATMVDSEKLLKLLNEELDIKDQPDAVPLIVTEGEIVFENVRFSYDSRVEALKGISFTIPKGSSVALVGESGSGKSTILRLLYRFYEVTSGRILIDGQDISKVTQASLRRAIGVVPQDSVLFNESIRYNIGYGREKATDEEIEEVARAAQLHHRILSFPDGYDTKVGERGVRLSGGEKQRVALARAMLKRPPICLFDESTASLDTTTEREIQQSLETLMKGRSSLTIAHRLSTIVNCTKIVCLRDGEILESGSHAELVAQNGYFASMWAKQISSEAEQLALAGVDSVGDIGDEKKGKSKD